jgi:hypothetical protein
MLLLGKGLGRNSWWNWLWQNVGRDTFFTNWREQTKSEWLAANELNHKRRKDFLAPWEVLAPATKVPLPLSPSPPTAEVAKPGPQHSRFQILLSASWLRVLSCLLWGLSWGRPRLTQVAFTESASPQRLSLSSFQSLYPVRGWPPDENLRRGPSQPCLPRENEMLTTALLRNLL